MGIVRMGMPQALVKMLVDDFSAPIFVETGTYYGQTSEWASTLFEKVFTIENSRELYEQTADRYKGVGNINFLLGDSRTHLIDLARTISEPTIFWLDAHWSGSNTYGKNDQCPLIEEIEIINTCQSDTYLLIDDARLFLSPPQPPHDIKQWPSLTEIVFALQATNTSRYIVVIEDCIVAVPAHAKDLVAAYCQKVNTDLWQKHIEELKTSDIKKAIHLIKKSVDMRAIDAFRKISKISSGLIS